MLTVITGAPGTGKSAALVSLLTDIGKNRAVYCSGIPDLAIEHVDLPDPSKWPDVVPDGSIIVIDEVQRVWRPRGPGVKVPPDIAALETHRHRGLDFYVVTQSPRLIDSNVRALCGRHVHLRDLGILGRFWYEWPEISDNCAASWKNAPIKKRYRLPKKVFGMYRSASEHIKPVRSVPWMLAVMVLALLLTAFLAWKAYGMISSRMNPLGVPPVAAPSVANVVDARTASAAPAPLVPVAYDYAQFIPRVSSRPESAPAYDAIRKVESMPVIAGCVCARICKCYTHQGTDTGLSDKEAREWLGARPFDPYRTPAPVTAGGPARAAPAAAAPAGGRPLSAPDASESPSVQSVQDGDVLRMMRSRS